MRDSQAEGVEDLRRELASLVVDWAGRMVKDDPASPLGQALTGAVREAARGAVTDQYQALARKDAEHIADAMERLRAERGRAGLFRLSPVALCAAGAAVLALAFAAGFLAGRAPPPPAAAAVVVDAYAPEPPLVPAQSPTPAVAAPVPPSAATASWAPARPAAATPEPAAPRASPARASPKPVASARPDAPAAEAPVSPNAGLLPLTGGGATAAAAQ